MSFERVIWKHNLEKMVEASREEGVGIVIENLEGEPDSLVIKPCRFINEAQWKRMIFTYQRTLYGVM
jgi:hypothetical protein